MKLAVPLALLLTMALAARAEEPATPVARLHDGLLAAMQDGPRLGFDGRARLLAPVVEQAYDMAGMTRTALGSAAARLSPDQVRRVEQSFTHYTVAVYARQFARWDGERFEVDTARPAHGGGILVPTRLVPAGGDSVALTYVVRQDGGGAWRIEDVLLDGAISQLAVRAAEFRTQVKLKGPDGLADSLEQRAAEQARP